MFEHEDVIAAILSLGIRGEAQHSDATDVVRRYEAVRKELLHAREDRARQELEEWDRHAHVKD